MLRTLARLATDALFPSFCVACSVYLERRDGKERAICDICLARIELAPREQIGGLALYPAGRYATPELRALVHALKYDHIRSAAEPLGELVAARLARESRFTESERWLLVPIPLHPAKERSRGFNHAALIAERVSARTGIACAPELLARTRNAPSQVTIREKRLRRANVARAFTAAARAKGARRLTRTRILLLDDVCTTGATLKEAARAMRRMGVETVEAVVAARATGRDDGV